MPIQRYRNRHQPLPVERQRVPVDWSVPDTQMPQLLAGKSGDQDDPWDLVTEWPWVHMQRANRAAPCIYAVRLYRENGRISIAEAYRNADTAQCYCCIATSIADLQGHAAYIKVLLHQLVWAGQNVSIPAAWLEHLNASRARFFATRPAKTEPHPPSPIAQAAPVAGFDRRLLLGAIVGDVVGSAYEASGCDMSAEPLLTEHSRFTDDSVMTCAVASALIERIPFAVALRRWGRRHPQAGYGQRFSNWLIDPEMAAFGSYGNGSAMRVAPVGLSAASQEECLLLAEDSALCSHDHPQAVRGAQAIALAIYLARQGETRNAIRERVAQATGYDLHRRLAAIRPHYTWSSECEHTVPQALLCFFEADDYEQTLRNALSLGGDADTHSGYGRERCSGLLGRRAG